MSVIATNNQDSGTYSTRKAFSWREAVVEMRQFHRQIEILPLDAGHDGQRLAEVD